MDESESIQRGFETRDASPRGIFLAGMLVFVGVLCAMAVSASLYLAHRSEAEPAASLGPDSSFTSSIEEQNSIQRSWEELESDLRTRRAADGGIPIDRAIDLVVEERKTTDP
ncbi:MAG: hypothetical protein ACREIA_00525 [Opitutaceae bacterium]